jgi:probable HAF family extracellular repeat protein
VHRRLLLPAIIACALGGSAASPTPAAVQYAITDIGTLSGPDSQVRAINDLGQVVGTSRDYNTDGRERPFLYSNGSMTDLGTLASPPSNGTAWAINNAGQIVGHSGSRAFLYSNNTLTDLSADLGSSTSYAYGINAAGQIVGQANALPFLLSNGTKTTLPTLGGSSGTAFDINSAGRIVGYSTTDTASGAPNHAFLYADNTLSDLGTLGGANSFARAINDAGQIVGNSDLSTPGVTHAFLYADGHMADLGTFGGNSSYALGISEAGAVLGQAEVTPGDNVNPHAFLYADGTFTDLNSLIDPSSGWVLNAAYGLNARGQIAGYGTINGTRLRGFLLTPVPEPTTLSLVFLAVAPLFSRRSSQRSSNTTRS